MKARVYIRVARSRSSRKGYRVSAQLTPNPASLLDSNGDVLPTVAFGLDLVIPDALFNRAAEVIAEIEIPEDQATIAATVTERAAA